MKAVINSKECTGCEACLNVCPLDAIQMKDGKASVIEENCGGCGVCADICPASAIRME
jgi:Pyruvate/2-oxoacid:ferredoxin oxidoreductase delta subunit